MAVFASRDMLSKEFQGSLEYILYPWNTGGSENI